MAGVGPRLELRQGQSLVMTPQLQQAIKLLQLSNVELAEYCEAELEKNSLLERDDREAAPIAEAPEASGDGAANERADVALSRDDFSKTSDMDEAAHDNMYDGEPRKTAEGPQSGSLTDWTTVKSGNAYDGEDSLESSVAADASLKDYLESQLSIAALLPEDRMILTALIDAVDETGYLRAELSDFANRLGCEVEDVQAVLGVLQGFDPVGVGARDLAECLSLQLRAHPPSPAREVALRICQDHLELLAKRDLKKLMAATEADEDVLRQAQALIVACEPKPGRPFVDAESHIIVPDVVVQRSGRALKVTLNPDVMPKLRINDLYAAALRGGKQGGASGLSTRLQEARWFMKNIQQRFDTILRVSKAIVERQKAFFTHGEIAMKPLVLREIADELGLHESTISRVTTAKYMATPGGTYELKYFFGSSLSTEAGGNASSTAVRALIKQMIGAEDPAKPLSDSTLSHMLEEQGIQVARRTVAKYRESLKIAPANLRKAM